MLHHFIVTRFNINEKTWKQNKNDKPAGDLVWLEKRIHLFLKFCLPSVVQQSCKKFSWLIFFEEGTQNELKKVLEVLNSYTFISVIFVNGMNGFNEGLLKHIKKATSKETSKIITTRLDNDDAIHRDFIKNIQNTCVDDVDKILLDFPMGLCLDISGDAKLSNFRFPKNQFISLLENMKDGELPKFVFSKFHHELDEVYPIKNLLQKDQWLQVVHEDNLVNTFKGQLTFKNALNGYPDYGIHFAKSYNFVVFVKNIKPKWNKLPGYYLFKKLFKKFI